MGPVVVRVGLDDAAAAAQLYESKQYQPSGRRSAEWNEQQCERQPSVYQVADEEATESRWW